MTDPHDLINIAFEGLACSQLPCTYELFRACCEDEKQEIASLVCCTMFNISKDMILKGEY